MANPPFVGQSLSAPSASGLGLIGRELSGYAEFQAANELYARVFGYSESGFSVNPNLLCALAGNGGSAVGVFAPGDELVGFAYGFLGRDATGHEYHYSQSAVVAAEYQGKGVGRQLKCLQRGVARKNGSSTMRWSFDPILTRNGHFNFSTLGAIGTEFCRDYYGRPGTNRLIAEWALGESEDPYEKARTAEAPSLVDAAWGEPQPDEGAVWLPVPSQPDEARRLGLEPQISEALEVIFAADRVLIDCRRLTETTTAYLAVPRVHDTGVPARGKFEGDQI